AEKIDDWQNRKLRKLINYAYQNTVYYKELFDKLKIRPEDIQTKDDLTKIPILTRQIIIENFEKLVSKKANSIPHIEAKTGGTTGTPMTYLLDKSSWSFSNADYIVNWERTDYNFGDKHVTLGGSSLFGANPRSLKHKIYYSLKGRIKLDGMHLSDELLKEYADIISKKKIKYIYGYASSIYLLAKYSLKNNRALKIKACFPTSEILTDNYRKTIMEAFDCKIVNCYGANDGGITAFEHNKGNFEVGYNVIMKVKEDQSKGPILLTNLLNYAMPMINYQLGDEVKATENSDGYNGQTMAEVYGRTPDIIRLDNGNVLTGFSFYERIFDLPVKAWNLEKKDGRTLVCKIIKQEGFDIDAERMLISKLKEYAGEDVDIEVNYFDKFELTSSGKRNYYMNV
ncbi:MAG: phenylacetate--CoA ligase family protein, partial [Flavobacteriaceae bacterium]|nr:phenylacetate--CoA ligase family protein [Flavobacteriaceae bacterium]